MLRPRVSVDTYHTDNARRALALGADVINDVGGLTDPAMVELAATSGKDFIAMHNLGVPADKSRVLPLDRDPTEAVEQWLEQHYPDKKNKILNRVRAIRGGKLNDPQFNSRMRGEGVYADQMAKLFDLARRRSGISERWPKLTTEHFRRPGADQLQLF